jgi:hypothetical protein
MGWVIGVMNFHDQGLDPIVALKLVERWASYTLLYFSYYFGWSGRMPASRVFRWMAVGIFFNAAFNIVELVHPTHYYLASGRTGGILGQANSNGLFLASYGFVMLVLARLARERLARWFYHGCFALSVLGIGLSLSRAAFLALLTNSVVYSFFRSKRMFAAIILAIALVLPVYSVVLPEKIAHRIDETFTASEYEGELGKIEGSAANRVMQYIATWHLFVDSPVFGHGINGFIYRSKQYVPAWAYRQLASPHSTFVNVTVDTGLLGLGSFLWLLTSLAWTGKRLYDVGETEEERLIGLFLITVMLGKLVANLFNTEFLTGDVSGYVWVTAGLASSLLLRKGAVQTVPQSLPERVTWRPRVRPPVPHG